MKVGIFGGSFDPIHNGHLSLARYVLDHTDIDEVWLMVAPLNPLKPQGYVASNEQRLEMAQLAVEGISGIKVSDFEFSLPTPSYTYNTLCRLKEAYPDVDFRLIIGGDNWANFDHWRNPQEILDEFGLIVYPRPGEEIRTPSNSQLIIDNSSLIILKNAPLMSLSSTAIRHLLSENVYQHSVLHDYVSSDNNSSLIINQSLVEVLPEKVLHYIEANSLYTE